MLRWMSVLVLTVAATFTTAACSSPVEGQPQEAQILTARSPVELRVVTDAVPPQPASPTPAPTAPGQTTLPDRTGKENYLVGPVELTLSRFTKVDSAPSQSGGGYVVSIGMLGDDAAKFAALTEKYVGRRVAIVIDGKVVMAPTIQSAISGGQVDISGQFSRAEAEDLARRLSGR